MSPWDTSGPSLIARECGFYLPGHKPMAERPAPIRKPKAVKPVKQPIPVEALRSHIAAGHTIKQTAEKFGMSESAVSWHIGARAVDLREPVNFREVRAFIAAGGSARQAAAHFHISKETLYQQLGSVLEIRPKLRRTRKGEA